MGKSLKTILSNLETILTVPTFVDNLMQSRDNFDQSRDKRKSEDFHICILRCV